MALQGLTLTTLIGWTFGIICLNGPWGRPKFTSWISLSLLIFLVNMGAFIFMIIDLYTNLGGGVFEVSWTPENMLLYIINVGAFIELMASNFLISLIFKIKAKKFAQLWGDLYLRNYEDAKRLQFYSCVWLSIAVSVGSSLTTIGFGCQELVGYARNYQRSYISFIGQTAYAIILSWVMVAPYTIPMNIGYGCVGCTLHHLKWVYDRYCEKIYEMMKLQGERLGGRHSHGEGHNKAMMNMMATSESKKKNQYSFKLPFKMTPELKEETYDEFEKIQDLFFLSEVTVSPLVLVMLSGGTLRLVLAAGRIAFETYDIPGFYSNEMFKLVRDIAYLVLTVGYLLVLQVGQAMLEKFTEWKEKLQKVSLELGLGIDLSYEARDMNDLHLMIRNWNWKFSACGFFDVDKRLVSGIISLLLTYSVILVQLKLTIDGIGGRNSTNSTPININHN